MEEKKVENRILAIDQNPTKKDKKKTFKNVTKAMKEGFSHKESFSGLGMHFMVLTRPEKKCVSESSNPQNTNPTEESCCRYTLPNMVAAKLRVIYGLAEFVGTFEEAVEHLATSPVLNLRAHVQLEKEGWSLFLTAKDDASLFPNVIDLLVGGSFVKSLAYEFCQPPEAATKIL